MMGFAETCNRERASAVEGLKPYKKCVDAMWCDLTFADLVSKNWHQLISLVGAFLVCQQKLTLRDAS